MVFQKGHQVSKEIRNKISIGLKGNTNGFKKGNKPINPFQKGNKYAFQKGHKPVNGFKKGEHNGVPFKKGERLGIKPTNPFQKGNKIGNRFKKGNEYAFKKGHNKGIPKSEEIRKKISNGLKDNHPSKETRRKMSNSQKGNTNGFKKGHPGLKKEKNPNWKNGITPENELIRKSPEYKEWRKKVFEKNNFTCQKCKDNKSGNLVAHHIQNFSDKPELRFCVDNGITFCVNCHNIFHKFYGIKHNNQEQIDEYLNE